MTTNDIDALGADLFERVIQPSLPKSAHGLFVAVDIVSGEYEVDRDELFAVRKLRSRMPNSTIWLGRSGYPAVCLVR